MTATLSATDLVLTWACEICDKPIADGTGYLWVHKGEVAELERRERDDLRKTTWEPIDFVALMAGPRLGVWHRHHRRWDPDPDAPAYSIDVERIRTVAHLLDWTVHLLGKRWIRHTDWRSVVERAAGQVGRVYA